MGCSTSKDGVIATGAEGSQGGRGASNGTTSGHNGHSELEAAATKIQATFRGHRVRKDEVVQKEEEQLNDRMGKLQTEATKPEEEIDIDLEDPEVMKAASKIQASFRAQFGKKK